MTKAPERWLADLLLEGAPLDEVERQLQAAGFATDEALQAIETVLCSPIFQAARPKVQLAQRLAAAAELHLQVTEDGGFVPRHNQLTAERFYSTWLRHHQPVVLEGFAQHWPALSWTPQSIAEALGDEPIEVLSGRTSADHPDRDYRQLRHSMIPRDFAALIESSGASNDVYLVARNHLMQRPAAVRLLDDIPISSDWVRRDNLSTCCSLWMGPAGTFTAAHHDTCSALFVQLVGRKRFELASPLQIDALSELEPYYLSHRNLNDVCDGVRIAELKPGDALLLPVGWWHQATALSVSVGMSFNGLHVANRFDAYCPGRL